MSTKFDDAWKNNVLPLVHLFSVLLLYISGFSDVSMGYKNVILGEKV